MSTATATDKLKLTITRTIAAPRELAFSCWTQQKHLARWGGAPDHMTAEVEEKNIRTGGRYRVRLRHEDGNVYTVQGKYLEVVRPERLVFTHCWVGDDGKPGEEMLVTITFDEVDGKTKMTLRQEGFTSAGSRDGHREGWSSQMDRFAAYVTERATR
jgi:uncharacterized protein YndB with AHSA1/START domain